jgi:hypothetical protein
MLTLNCRIAARLTLTLCLLSGIVGCDRRRETTAPQSVTVLAGQKVRAAASLDPSINPSGLPVIAIDARHAVRERDGFGVPYVISAARGLVVDARHMNFTDPLRMARRPNAIRILFEKSEFSAPWPQEGSAICRLDGSSLRPIAGSKFSGFEAGKRVAVGIGYETTNPTTGHSRFEQFWVGWIIFN